MENILDFFDEEWFKKAVVESRERGCTAFSKIARGDFYRDFDLRSFGILFKNYFSKEEQKRFSRVVENILADKDFKRENKRAWQDVWLIATEIGLRNYYKHRGLKKKHRQNITRLVLNKNGYCWLFSSIHGLVKHFLPF